MENAIEALKIAGAVLMFVLALTLSISSLSQANSAVSSIATMYDKDAQSTYVQPAQDLTRVVGMETIIPTMYKAYEENIEIYFFKADGSPLPIYYKTNQYGSRVDSEGKSVANSNPNAVTVNYIDLSKESFGTENGKEATQVATEHLSLILAGGNKWKNQYRNNQEMLNLLDEKKYGNQLMDTEYPNGFYAYLNGKKFVEKLGEYYQGSNQDEDESLASTTATKIKKRVITYKLTN